MKHKVLAIIPARGGSKGVPRKNVLPVAGKPLIAHTLAAALDSEQVDRVVVSTDDSEIASVTEQYGGEVVWRPEEIAGDLSSSEAALMHVLDTLKANEDYEPDLIVFLQCTSPLTIAADIDGTVEKLEREKADTALAVVDFHYFVWQQEQDGNAAGVNHDKRVRKMRQEREPQYLETGAIYVMRTAGFRESGHRFFGKTALYEMPLERQLEIDDFADFDVAEVRLRQRHAADQTDLLPDPLGAIVFDFDGVFTDNLVLVDQDGHEAAYCSRGDGMGIGQLKKTGIPLLVLSKEPVPIVVHRCKKLGLECLHGVDNKLPLLDKWLDERGISRESTVYVGNDINDRECLAAMGCGVVPADAHPDVIPVANIVLDYPGGKGAVRQLADWVCGKYEQS